MLSPYAALGRYNNGGPTGVSVASLFKPRYSPYAGAPSSVAPGTGSVFAGTPPPTFTPFTRTTGMPTLPPETHRVAAPGTTAAAPSNASQQAAGLGDIDYSQDPILLKVKAQADQIKADAKAAAISAEKTNLIRYGDPDLVAKILGKDAGDTAQSARDNPFSTVAELGRWNTRQGVDLNESFNNENLFYSTARARGLALQGEDYQRQSSKTASDLQDALTQIAQDRLARNQQAQQMVLAEEESAYQRALAEAQAQQYYASIAAASASTSGGGDGGGGGGGGGGGVDLSGLGRHPISETSPTWAAALGGYAPWQATTPLSNLPPDDIRVRRLA